MITIREAAIGDEGELVKLFYTLDQETEFMLMEPGERTLSIEQQAEILKQFSQSSAKVIFVALEGNKIVGFIGGTGGEANRNRHSISIAMGVLASHCSVGIGTQLLQRLFDWATLHQFHRVELTVMDSNVRALALYEKLGFEVEGVKRHSLKISGTYINERYMAKLI